MNLVTQFPDISMDIREQTMRGTRKAAVPRRSARVKPEKSVVKVYDRDFRRWHLKVLLMIVALLASTYLIALNSPWMFSLIS